MSKKDENNICPYCGEPLDDNSSCKYCEAYFGKNTKDISALDHKLIFEMESLKKEIIRTRYFAYGSIIGLVLFFLIWLISNQTPRPFATPDHIYANSFILVDSAGNPRAGLFMDDDNPKLIFATNEGGFDEMQIGLFEYGERGIHIKHEGQVRLRLSYAPTSDVNGLVFYNKDVIPITMLAQNENDSRMIFYSEDGLEQVLINANENVSNIKLTPANIGAGILITDENDLIRVGVGLIDDITGINLVNASGRTTWSAP